MKKPVVLIPIVILAAAVAVRIVLFVAKGSGGGGKMGGMPPVAVEVDSVRFGPIEEIREFTGSVFPYNQYVVSPKVSGRVVEIHKRIGDSVRAGELIARIDDAEYRQALLEAEANLRIAEASVEEAASQLALSRDQKERMESLRAKDLASNAELDAALADFAAKQSRHELSRAQVEQREAALESARIRLGYTRLAASRAGYIGERFVDEGALLAPNAAVVSVIEIASVIVRSSVAERDYRLVKPGQPAEVSVDALPEKAFSGRVSRIAPMLQETSRMAQIEVEVSNPGLLLKPGMFARIRVKIASRDAAQIVPNRAVVSTAAGTGVFLVREGETAARFVPVETGIVTADRAEIVSPALEGRVVTLGQHLLADGSPVLLPQGPPAKAGDAGKPAGGKAER